MGATLSYRAELTSESDKESKFDSSNLNEVLLLVENLCKEHTREALVPFKRPFIWTSALELAQFDSLKSNKEYIFR